MLPGLAMAARTVGSPQIRNRGTVGGNLGTASPAGDCHPVLLATGAAIEVRLGARHAGVIPAVEFFTGPKRNALAPDELITAILLPPAPGPQLFAKVGTRNAMVIAVCSLALALPSRPSRADSVIVGRSDRLSGRAAHDACDARVAIGSAGPVPLRATEAEEFLAGELAAGELTDAAIAPVRRARRGGGATRSTTCGAPRLTGGMLSGCSHGGRLPGQLGRRRPPDASVHDGQRRSRIADDVWPGESPAVRAARAARLPGSKNACEQGECGSCTVYSTACRSAPAWSPPARPRAARS